MAIAKRSAGRTRRYGGAAAAPKTETVRFEQKPLKSAENLALPGQIA